MNGNNPLHALYNYVRPKLPRKTATYCDIPVRDARILDVQTSHPGHKDILIDSIRDRVRPGESVCVIGGGRGIAAVVASQETGESGHVTVIEAAREQCDRTQRTVEESGYSSRVHVRQAIVGYLIDPWGDTSGAEYLSVSELPGDVWIVDIEGGELALLSSLTESTAPRVCIIETHEDADVNLEDAILYLVEIYDNLDVKYPGEDTTAIGGPVVIASR